MVELAGNACPLAPRRIDLNRAGQQGIVSEVWAVVLFRLGALDAQGSSLRWRAMDCLCPDGHVRRRQHPAQLTVAPAHGASAMNRDLRINITRAELMGRGVYVF